ncbi:MAG TPA: ACT domain-containing protein [Desulfatirhabdiaceae bacterium]|nr:ACT domain-containing protein [Desulfatirhabdiaceae bacterium]
MKVKQISVFLENKAGRLSEVTAILSEADINIRALSLADTSDFGVLRLIVNNSAKALDALKNNGFSVGVTDVVAVEVMDRPGGLHHILNLLHQSKINVEYMYAFVQQSGKNAVMIFRFDHTNEAIDILSKDGIAIIDGENLYEL